MPFTLIFIGMLGTMLDLGVWHVAGLQVMFVVGCWVASRLSARWRARTIRKDIGR